MSKLLSKIAALTLLCLNPALVVPALADTPPVTSTAAPATPEIISHISYQRLLALMPDTGITAERITSDDGISYLVGTYRNTSFIMRLIECESVAAEKCTTLAIFANFIEQDDGKISETDKQKINSYNESEIFGRAYFAGDQTALGVDMVISVEGGVTEDYVKAQLSNWTDALGGFLSQLSDPE